MWQLAEVEPYCPQPMLTHADVFFAGFSGLVGPRLGSELRAIAAMRGAAQPLATLRLAYLQRALFPRFFCKGMWPWHMSHACRC